MPLDRDELQRQLAQLEADLPALLAQYPDAADINPAFADREDEIMGYACPADEAWAFEQLDGMLERFGLWRPDQEELPPDG